MNRSLVMGIAWIWVGAPFAYGVYKLVERVTQLFA
jgi:hypothetical protein